MNKELNCDKKISINQHDSIIIDQLIFLNKFKLGYIRNQYDLDKSYNEYCNNTLKQISKIMKMQSETYIKITTIRNKFGFIFTEENLEQSIENLKELLLSQKTIISTYDLPLTQEITYDSKIKKEITYDSKIKKEITYDSKIKKEINNEIFKKYCKEILIDELYEDGDEDKIIDIEKLLIYNIKNFFIMICEEIYEYISTNMITLDEIKENFGINLSESEFKDPEITKILLEKYNKVLPLIMEVLIKISVNVITIFEEEEYFKFYSHALDENDENSYVNIKTKIFCKLIKNSEDISHIEDIKNFEDIKILLYYINGWTDAIDKKSNYNKNIYYNYGYIKSSQTFNQLKLLEEDEKWD
jgi:hypothetical protein